MRNSTAYTMAVIFNTICETHSDVLVDPYLNGASGPPEPSCAIFIFTRPKLNYGKGIISLGIFQPPVP